MVNEKRLIDANALKNFVCETCNAINGDEPCEPCDCRSMTLIDEMPTVDAVEVVRCKDCKHYTPVEGGKPLCALHSIAVAYDDFCSYGERREGE